ncbi:MAG: TonB-dependent receptor [Pseudomonadota bacterium]
MHNKKRLIAAVLAGVSTAAPAAEQEVAPIIVTATRHAMSDTDAPYASEVHTRSDISQSGARGLYDYLDRNTSLTVMPSYGNPFSQKLDMRGFGIGSGYQNIVVTVDGRRLNNVDMVPQLLGAIPLASIEQIEITKGSGSVIYGDGATAGAIHIHTRKDTGVSASVSAGNHGVSNTSVSAGLNEGIAALNIYAENYHHDGFSDRDINNRRDAANSNTTHAELSLFPTDILELRLGGGQSRIDTTYRGSLTQEQFEEDPAQNGGDDYTNQLYNVDELNAGLTAEINPSLKLSFDHFSEDKLSEYSSGWSSDYENRSNELALSYQQGALTFSGGIQRFAGTRYGLDNETDKTNRAAYLQGDYALGKTTVSLGGRRAEVEYRYNPDTGDTLDETIDLNAYDIGVNHRYNKRLSLFANYNNAFQAPDIDRFFTTDWFTMTTSFNGFIEPAHSKTLNIGLNHVTARNRIKLTTFYSELTDEIYYYKTGPWSGLNTNIDESHKYGLELQARHQFNRRFSTSLNYAYTRAIIDSEDSADGEFDGNELPGVSAHTATVSLDYQPTERSRVDLSHTYRSEAYAAEDFGNDFEQKQAAYNSTAIGYHYQVGKMELFAKVDNLFEEENGVWVRDDAIYPVNFTRNWRVGLNAEF